MKFTITAEGVDDVSALYYAMKVVQGGLVSKEETQYCYVTTFTNGVRVYADRTRTGTHTFKVRKP